ncbi:glycosyl hydrolase family 61-domain-containing protein [Massariosphaeria phaeospora]|uniref:lytic cellulose monooxygenase (C4-dehydrogenating) n=1 Tax=Massariosphaeria phaeospora TaxID=100035 RepID=A0A7C8I481_9PLEO|nr:glycosyl hydrolase family 61-domain-containing protein [Massariosphaeria phaeospora]
MTGTQALSDISLEDRHPLFGKMIERSGEKSEFDNPPLDAYHEDYFPSFIVNNIVTPPFKHVREIADAPGYPAGHEVKKGHPVEDIYHRDITCNRDAFNAAAKTETADVIAGSEVGFHIFVGTPNKDWDGYNYIFHDGPAQAYLARAPGDDLSTFTGYDGQWFKIASITAAENTTPNPNYWIVYQKAKIEFSIPTKTPPGKYLLRMEHFMRGNDYGPPQFYVSCAHINVMGSGGGSLDGYDFAKFPGTYNLSDPAIMYKVDAPYDPMELLNYVGPGPKVWTGE